MGPRLTAKSYYSERRLGTSEVSLYDDHKLALSDKRILYLIGK